MGYTAVQYTNIYSEPMSTRLLNSIFSGICRQNTQFNMYSTTSKGRDKTLNRNAETELGIKRRIEDKMRNLAIQAKSPGEQNVNFM